MQMGFSRSLLWILLGAIHIAYACSAATVTQRLPETTRALGLRGEAAGSRLKRPSNVGELIDRNRAYEASAMSPIYVEQDSKLRRREEDQGSLSASARPGLQIECSGADRDVWSCSPASGYSVETASATPFSRASPAYRHAASPPTLSEKVDMTLATPRLDPKLESAVRFGRKDVEFEFGGEDKQHISVPSPFLRNDVHAFKASVLPKQLNFDVDTPKISEKVRTSLDHNAPEEISQQAVGLLLQAREELMELKERWKGAEATSKQKMSQVSSLLVEIAELEKEVDGVSAQKEALRAEVERSNHQNLRLSDELAQVRSDHQDAVRLHASVTKEKEELERELDQLQQRLAVSAAGVEHDHEYDQQQQDRLSEGLREGGSMDADSAALLHRIADLKATVEAYREEKESLWQRAGELQQYATDSEQLQVSQRQQLNALCRSLEASEEERSSLVSRLDVFANQQKLLQEQYESEMLSARAHFETKVQVLRFELAKSVDQVDQSSNELARMEQELQRSHTAYEAGQEEWREEHAALSFQLAQLQTTGTASKAEMVALGAEIEAGKKTIEQLKADLASSFDERVRVVAEVEAQLQREIEAERVKTRRLKEEAEKARSGVAAIEKELEEVRGHGEEQIVLANGRLEEERGRVREAEEQIAALKSHSQSLEGLLEESRARAGELAAELQEVQLQLAQLKAGLASKEAENERLAGEVERHGEEQREARRELAQCQDRLAALQSEHAQAAQTITGQLEAMRGEKAAVEAENEELREKAAGVCAREEGLEARIVSLLEEEERLNESCDELQQRLGAAAAKEERLESEIEKLEDLLRSRDLVLEDKEKEWGERVEEEGRRREEVEGRLGAAEEAKEAAKEEAARCREELRSLEARSKGVQEHVQELEHKCAEADKIARLATRSSSKELNAAQAQASHLRQQLESLTKERDQAEAARQRQEEELASARKQMAAEVAEAERRYQSLLSEVQSQSRKSSEGARASGERDGERDGDVGEGGDSAPGSPAEMMMQSVVAQRTRGRINDSARQARVAALKDDKAAEHEQLEFEPAGEREKAQLRGSEEASDGVQLQSVVAKRTRGRTMDKDYAFFLRHIPVAGTAPSVKIPDTVQLSHTGFVIGRVGSDLVLNSGYVSRKHAQLQRTATGWRVLDTSTNGLCVNGVKVKSQQLSDGDVLLFEVPQTVGFNQEVPQNWDEKSHFRFRFCVQPVGPQR